MRTYGQRFLKAAGDKAAKARQETRDAILWDILATDRIARVKIQGSDQLIYARFPQNWETIPAWAKPGQAVRITHRGGTRGYVEITGYGRSVPTPISGAAAPTIPTPYNAILSGLSIMPIPQTPRMAVYISTGMARFDGTEKPIPPALATASSPIKADMGLILGQVAQVFEIAAPSTGYFRYDAFSVGEDLLVYKTTGTPFTATESKPSIPAGNLLIGYLLTHGGQTAITASDIAAEWSTPEPSQFSIATTDNGSTWNITVEVQDQYGRLITTATGWTIAATLGGGTGSIAPASGNTGTGSSYTFTYTEGTAGDLISIEFGLNHGSYAVTGLAQIQL